MEIFIGYIYKYLSAF